VITPEEARERILEGVAPLEKERVALLDTLGRVLAEDVVSDIDVAPFDNSAMDGYAVRAADVAGATPEKPVVLRVVDYVAAGSLPEKPVGPGEATRIMTGAPMPEGADAVVMVEVTRGLDLDGGPEGTVEIQRAVRAEENVRFRGEDVRVGDVVLRAGERADAAAIGLMAAMGYPEVFCVRRPRVGIVSTGDELVEVGEKPGPGKIRNSNAYSLAAQVLDAGGEPHILGIARDTEADTRTMLARAPEFDAMLSTGGVSMGDFDVVRNVLESLGSMSFWKVAQRPGSPLTYGVIEDTPFFGLPGNPTASMVSFELYVRPVLRVLGGFTTIDRPRTPAVLEHDARKKAGKRYYWRGVLGEGSGGGYSVSLTGSQSSALLTSMHAANCLVVLPEDETAFPAGTLVDCIRLDMEEGTA
jgi:molybdopterin molybdotransferase